ncbi:MAG TPA: MFS transporter [Miltoncostaeaceae bacterium]|nr:MFS transporter [Miltoncostaeaceae bacterium]
MVREARTRLEGTRASLRARPRWRWMALLVVACGMMLSVVNVSIVNIALPDMAADLGVDVAFAGWVVSGFLVTQATMLPTAGRAGDLFGRRRVFVAGVLVVSAASVGCALSWDAHSLIAFRVLQGVGASALAPTAFAYATELFAPEERAAAMGLLGGVLGLAPVLSLNIAGVLVEAAGWRSVFWFSPVIGAALLAGAALVLDERRAPGRHRSFDVPGAALAAVALVGVLLALSRGGAWGWTAAPTLAAGLAGAVGALAFVVHERRAAEPMMDLALFRVRSLRTANLAGGLSAAALFGMLVMLPFFLTAAEDLSPVGLGLAISPVALCFVVAAPLSGRLVALGHVPSHVVAASGLALGAAGTLWMAVVAQHQSYALTLPGMLALGVGLAASSAPITTTALSEVPPARLGVAASLPNICRYTGAGVGVAALGAALAASIPGDPADAADAAVAGGFRAAALLGAGFLALAALTAARMPRQPSRRAAGAVAAAGRPVP